MAERQATHLPRVVWSGELPILGRTLKVHVLDTGQRVIDQESIEEFCAALASGADPDPAEVEQLARWLHGGARG